ncbi:DUF3788 domain-containing protein [Candidatus Enterococcus ferrettii]|uniref:DUF3788 domain-containing protein n=1 Tax=Candidatus Enterococcus ferrettii TaxID=2815324 RepID=A0ABV0EM98_9ENTE|nr:DUF3788 domain-containing protein [Enterococcus sp. 665A]
MIKEKAGDEMTWKKCFPAKTQPTKEQIAAFIDNPLWFQFNDYLQQAYEVEPKYSYSGCSMQAGWNIKYVKSGKSLCTLYPMEGYFISLVVIGKKEMASAEELMPLVSPYVQKVFTGAKVGQGQKWLMLDMKEMAVLEDTLKLIALRREPQHQIEWRINNDED